MISLLYDTSALWSILIFASAILIILALIKYPTAKWFMGTIITLALIISTCYCAIQLNFYYTASGGIYGKITGMFDTNVVEIQELNFSLKNIELVKEHDNTYSAEVLNGNVMKLNGKNNFAVYVNNEPCSLSQVENEEDYCFANYTYVFYDKDKNILCEDTLTFRFAFYTKFTYLSVTTNGGANAVKYWNYYFNKNVFDIKIENVDFNINKDISFLEDYCLVSFELEDDLECCAENGSQLPPLTNGKIVYSELVKKGSKLKDYPIINFYLYFYSSCYQYFPNVNGGKDFKKAFLTGVYYELSSCYVDIMEQTFYESKIVKVIPIYKPSQTSSGGGLIGGGGVIPPDIGTPISPVTGNRVV